MYTIKKNKLLIILLIIVGLYSCKDDDDNNIVKDDEIKFIGSYSRYFDVQGVSQRATYTITKDKINYDLSGGFQQTNYDIEKKYFSTKDNRWIGYRESNSTYYLIFFKDTKEKEFTLYKKEIESLEAGKSEAIPSVDEKKNYGWNKYIKNLSVKGSFKNLHALQKSDYTKNPPVVTGNFIKFSFSEGKVTTSETDWDIAFRGTTIIVNGGKASGIAEEPKRTGKAAAYLAKGTFESINQISEDLFKQDSKEGGLAIKTGSGNGWYNYNSNTHIIEPIPGKVLVFKTFDGKYAKIEILSYYKDAPDKITKETPSQYYSFNYEYQKTEGVASFK